MEHPRFFDIHSHLNDKAFDTDRSDVISRMRAHDVWTITVGTDKEMSQEACDISETSEGLFAAIGVHPIDNSQEIFDPQFYRSLAQSNKKVVAIGECGLDHFRIPQENLESEKKRQRDLFEVQIDLAAGLDLSLMIHCRDAHQDAIDILRAKKREYGEKLRGNIHFFADTIETAKKYFDLDFTVSFTGVITFASQYNEVIAYAPLSHIMSETDAPYVAPVPYRGKRCEPWQVEEVVKKIADIRGDDLEMVQKILVENAMRVFQINPKS